jgi:hypothetical protein
MYSSVCFLQNVDSDQLSMTAEQFEQGIAETRAQMGGREGTAEPVIDRLREGSVDQFDMEDEPDTGMGSPPRHRKRPNSGHFNAASILEMTKGQWLGPDVLAVRQVRLEREQQQGRGEVGGDEDAVGAGGAALKGGAQEEAQEEVQQQFRFLHTAPSELQIADVPVLLREYQALARQVLELTNGGACGGQAVGEPGQAGRGALPAGQPPAPAPAKPAAFTPL